MEKGFRINVGQRSANWITGEVSFNGNTRTLDLLLPTVEKCKQIIEIAELKSWEILEMINDGWNGNLVERTSDMDAFYNKAKEDSENHDEYMRKAAEAINELPIKFHIDTGVKGLSMWVERTGYEYNPSYSRSFQNGSLDVKYQLEGQGYRSFWFDGYTTKDGKLLRKKFAQDSEYLFGVLCFQINLDSFLKAIQSKLFEVKSMINEAKQKVKG